MGQWGKMRALEFRVFDCLLEEVRDTTNEVAIEEPLRIYVDGQPVAATMRLPGEEIPLAVGICFTHEFIESEEDIQTITYPFEGSRNRIAIFTRRGRPLAAMDATMKKDLLLHGASAFSGKEMLGEIRKRCGTVPFSVRTSIRKISELQRVIEDKQQMFSTTGCTHGAAIFSGGGEFIAFAEDVGRNNALDKAIGKTILKGERHSAKIAALTSRLSFEMMQKAARFGLEIVCAVSAPTSLGIELAKALNITLVGFWRPGRANIYSRPERLFPETKCIYETAKAG